MTLQLHHINDDSIRFSVLPRRNYCQLPKQHASKNYIRPALRKIGGTEVCAERKLLINTIQERRRKLWLPMKIETQCSLHNRSTWNPIHHPYQSRTNCRTSRDQQIQLREPRPWPFRGSEGFQGVGQPEACRQKTNRGSSEQNVSFRSFWPHLGICTSLCEGNYCAFLYRVRTGGVPRPRRESIKVIWAVGRKPNLPRICKTRPGNSIFRKRWRTEDLRQRYWWYYMHCCIKHRPIYDDCKKWDDRLRDEKPGRTSRPTKSQWNLRKGVSQSKQPERDGLDSG